MEVSSTNTRCEIQISIDSENPTQPTSFIVSDIPTNQNHHTTSDVSSQMLQTTRLKYKIQPPALPLPPLQSGSPINPSTISTLPGYHCHRVINSILHDNPHYGTQYDRCRNRDYRWSPSMRPSLVHREMPYPTHDYKSPVSLHTTNALRKEVCASTPSAISIMINDAASKYRVLVQKECKPDSNDTTKSQTTESTQSIKGIENGQTEFEEYAVEIFSRSKGIIRDALQPLWTYEGLKYDIVSQRLYQSIGAMKGITEGICILLDEAMDKLSKKTSFGAFHKDMSGYCLKIMHSLFEKEVLVVFCAILLRAPMETRDGLSRYLSSDAFSKYFEVGTALKGQLHRILSASESKLIKMRDEEEREIFEKTTTHLLNQVNESNESKFRQNQSSAINLVDDNDGDNRDGVSGSDAVKAGDITKQSYSPRYGTPFPFTPMYYQYPVHPVVKRQRLDFKYGEGEENLFDSSRKRMRRMKRRREERKGKAYRLVPDGKWRKKQRNPCKHKKCRNPLQTDGVTTGCGGGTHPRTLCKCWLELGFRKGDWKNGKIHKWLEERYPSKGFDWQ